MNHDPERIAEQHQAWLRTVLAARVRDASVVDDLLQEVLLVLFEQRHKLRQVKRIEPWLYRIAIRRVLQYRRRLGRERRRLERLQRMASHSAAPAQVSDPIIWLIAAEAGSKLAAALDALGGQDREMILLRHVHDWTYRQLSDSLGLAKSTIEYRLERARQRLRDLLSRDEPEDKPPLAGNTQSKLVSSDHAGLAERSQSNTR